MDAEVSKKGGVAHFRASINGAEIAVMSILEFPEKEYGTVLDGEELLSALRSAFVGHVHRLAEIAGEYETKREIWRPEYKAAVGTAALLKQKYRQGVQSGDVMERESMVAWLSRRVSVEFVI